MACNDYVYDAALDRAMAGVRVLQKGLPALFTKKRKRAAKPPDVWVPTSAELKDIEKVGERHDFQVEGAWAGTYAY